MTDQFLLALFSLGASGAAIGLALYLIKASRRTFPSSNPLPPEPEKPPVYKPVESIGLRLKRKIDGKD